VFTIKTDNRDTAILHQAIHSLEKVGGVSAAPRVLSGEYLGASEVNVIMTQRNRSAYNLAQEKVGIIPRKEVDNIYTRYGNEMEPLIINEIEKQGCRFMTAKQRCHDYKLSGVLDGIDYERNIILEVKTFTYIPDMQSYLNQIHVYFHIFKMEKAILALYQRNEHFDPKAIELYNISIDKQRLQNILTAVKTFWKKAEILRNNPEMKKKQFDALEAK
jgi:predicted phage-related endonuclease